MKMGDRVVQGQLTAEMGNSGFAGSHPHRHYGVYQSYPLRDEYDVPVNFRNSDGSLDDRGGLIQ